MLTKETVQMIVNYLQTKPYGEVYTIIGKIFAEVAESTKAEVPDVKE